MTPFDIGADRLHWDRDTATFSTPGLLWSSRWRCARADIDHALALPVESLRRDGRLHVKYVCYVVLRDGLHHPWFWWVGMTTEVDALERALVEALGGIGVRVIRLRE